MDPAAYFDHFREDSTSVCRSKRDWMPKIVPEGKYFGHGHNRDESRLPLLGSVGRETIRGKAMIIYWSRQAPPTSAGSAWAR